MKTIRIGDVQNSLIRLILWQVGKEPITDKHIQAAKDYFDNKCAYCEEVKSLVFDHAVPINKPALDQHRVGNLVLSCADCNQKKGQRDFRDYLRDYPDCDMKVTKILRYMQRHNYVPLNDDKKVKALLETARKEVHDTVEKYIAAVNESLANIPTAQIPPLIELLAVPAIPALRSVVSGALAGVNGSTHKGSDLAKISKIKRVKNRSWINLRRGCLDQMGVSVAHGTPKVRASSRAFAKRAHEATGLKYPDIIEMLDRHSLGLEG